MLAARAGFQSRDRNEQIGQVVLVGQVETALHTVEAVGRQGGADVGVGLRYAPRMICCGLRDLQIEGDGEHYRSRGSSRMLVSL